MPIIYKIGVVRVLLLILIIELCCLCISLVSCILYIKKNFNFNGINDTDYIFIISDDNKNKVIIKKNIVELKKNKQGCYELHKYRFK